MNSLLLRITRLLGLRSVPSHIIVITALASYGAQIFAGLQGWPLWAIVVATLLPWLPVFTNELVWTYRHYHWLAFFYLLVVTQGGHFLEHLAQMYQMHIMGLHGMAARGIIGQLDIEWVHFIFNSWVLFGALVLLYRFPRNPWLWATLVIAGWHEIEHLYIMSAFLSTGKPGTPGLLSRGGAISGGLPIMRPDLHFYYNVAETVPLVIAFIYQLNKSYNEWLSKAFPHLPTSMLVETTNHLEPVRFKPGDTIVRQGDAADRFYIITKGQLEVIRRAQDGMEAKIDELGPGQFFGEVGLLAQTPRTATVRAKTAVEVLALDQAAFRALVESSEVTSENLAQLVQTRLAAATS